MYQNVSYLNLDQQRRRRESREQDEDNPPNDYLVLSFTLFVIISPYVGVAAFLFSMGSIIATVEGEV